MTPALQISPPPPPPACRGPADHGLLLPASAAAAAADTEADNRPTGRATGRLVGRPLGGFIINVLPNIHWSVSRRRKNVLTNVLRLVASRPPFLRPLRLLLLVLLTLLLLLLVA